MPKRRKSPAERQAAKDRKKAKVSAARAAAAARQSEIERAAAIRAEAIAEEQAPAAQRLAVVAPERTVVRFGIEIVVPAQVVSEAKADPDLKRGGYRRFDPLRRMHEKNSRLVTSRHLSAVDKLARDYESGVLLGTNGNNNPDRISGGGGSGPADFQLKAAQRYRQACDAMGEHRTFVQWMGLHQWGLDECRKAAGVRWETARDRLIGALDRLEAFYLPPPATNPAPVLVLAPARESYTTVLETT